MIRRRSAPYPVIRSRMGMHAESAVPFPGMVGLSGDAWLTVLKNI